MPWTCDVLIVGGGVTGLSTALHLALRKCGRIRVLERHYVGAGQSGRAAGIIRSTVRHAGLSRWQTESARFFQNLAEQFGEGIPVHPAGYLLATDQDHSASVEDAIRVATSTGCRVSRIDAQEANDLQPGLRSDDRTIYAFEPGAVHLDPMEATQALARIVRTLGVEIVEGCEVQRLEVAGPMVRVATETETVESPIVLLGTSCWMPLQMERFGQPLPVRPHRAEMCFFQVPARSDRRLQRILSDAAAGIYLRPEGSNQMFVGWREGDWVKSLEDCVLQDPDQCRQTAESSTVRKMHQALSTTLPWMREGFVHRTFACTYDYSPDGMPILDRLEGPAGIYFAAGFSGGGFSLSPFVGRTMAEYIDTGRRPDDIVELSWQRFRDGKTIQWSNN